jgi:hypothetical protein
MVLKAFAPLADPVVTTEQEVRWIYWAVAYLDGDPTVIGGPLPLSGVKMSEIIRGVGQLDASLQLTDPDVRALDPWSLIIDGKTGIVAVRQFYDTASGAWFDSYLWHGTVLRSPIDPITGRMAITALTVEGNWARWLITKANTWTSVDQQQIAADLLDPSKFSLIPLGAGRFTGWINVDPPTTPTGVLRTFAYADRQETGLLDAHQARSQLQTNSYEWTTGVKVLAGADGASASTFRLQYLLGYPRLGRKVTDEVPVPRFTLDTRGSGNVLSYRYERDRTNVPNVVWGRGNGYEDQQIKAQVQNTDAQGNNEWDYGFLRSEVRFSDPDVSDVNTLTAYCYRLMWDRLGSSKFLTALKVSGNTPPYFGTYSKGDDLILQTNDLTWPSDRYNSDGNVEITSRIFGWTITPPQGEQSEQIELVVAGGLT